MKLERLYHMPDVIEKIGKSIIQHGPYSRRVYLMKLHPQDAQRIRSEMERLVSEHAYDKIVAKIPASLELEFREYGYVREAIIPDYFHSGEHAIYMAKYFSAEREKRVDQEKVQEVLSLALERKQDSETGARDVAVQVCELGDLYAMVGLYKAVFETYPFPIFKADFLAEAIQKRYSQYFCVRQHGRMVALAASEIDWSNQGVEMTDFATLPECRGQGLAGCLLREMERAMQQEGMRIAFSIARAVSPSMSIVFAANGYSFGGTLGNNTNIAGHIQSMNVWHKQLQPV